MDAAIASIGYLLGYFGPLIVIILFIYGIYRLFKFLGRKK